MFNIKLIVLINITALNINGENILKNKSKIFNNDLEYILRQNNKELFDMKEQNFKPCDDHWISYSHNKCIKVLSQKGSLDEAKGKCSEFGSTLITIQSNEEQTFMTQILQNYQNVSDYIWIGLELSNNSYKWLDGNDVKYENWAENANKIERCVQMSLEDSTLGKWTDVLCDQKCLIVCQKNKTIFNEELINSTEITENDFKNQENSINDIKRNNDFKIIMVKYFNEQQSQIDIQKKLLDNLTNKVKVLEQLTIPIGFIYTQLPNQSLPLDMWPNTTWIEVTQEYSGLFFRAEGRESEPFGQIQQANQSWISDIHLAGAYYSNWSGWIYKKYSTRLFRQMWVNVARGGERAVEFLKFYTTGGEVRPINTAIKIWKRIL